MVAIRTVYQCADGMWARQLMSGGKTIVTDGGQDYENKADARAMAGRIIWAQFKRREETRRPK